MAREISYLSPPNFLSCSLTHIFIQPRVCVCLPFYVKEDRPRALLRRTIFQFLFCLFFSLSSLSLSIYTLIYGQTNSEKKSKKRRGIIRPGFFFGLDVDMWSKPRGILELGLGGFGVVHARESRAGGLVGLGGSYIINHETRMCFMSYQQPPFFFSSFTTTCPLFRTYPFFPCPFVARGLDRHVFFIPLFGSFSWVMLDARRLCRGW